MKNQTYHIVTIGCQMNKSDSERIAGYLERRNFIASSNPNKSDLVVFTTCGVRQSAEDRIYGLVPKIKKANPKVKIILTGCLSQRKDVIKRLRDNVDVWLPIKELNNLAEKLGLEKKESIKEAEPTTGNSTSNADSGSLSSYLNIVPKHKSAFSAYVPIGNGCDNFCSYCVVPYARGREAYRPAEEIIDEVKALVKNGYKEIILIAQNVNSYISRKQKNKKATKQVNFPELLRMINDIKGDFWIRFATSHPKDMSDELIKTIAKCEKVCEHIHLPVQSGDNEILRRMNRKYTVEHYLGLIKKIRKNSKFEIRNSKLIAWRPPVSITTDIIVGFPGETKKQFNQTAKLFRDVGFDMAYIAQYSPRPGTVSFKMKDNISKDEKKRREEELTKILRKTALENNKKYIGKVVEVLVEGKNKGGEWFGKTRTYKNVKCLPAMLRKARRAGQMSNVKLNTGSFIIVKITKVKDFGLEGELESKKVNK